ncbi:MAG: hypothetical protein NWP69_13155, partial [Congregibacter sp.]|nr:hypothetical protein [Congregibacter sp.]
GFYYWRWVGRMRAPTSLPAALASDEGGVPAWHYPRQGRPGTGSALYQAGDAYRDVLSVASSVTFNAYYSVIGVYDVPICASFRQAHAAQGARD